MPTYQVTSPDGQKYRITAPEGASQEDALAHFQSNFQQSSQTTPSKPNVDMFDTISDNALQGATFGIGNRASAGLAAAALTLDQKGFGASWDDLASNYQKAREAGSARLHEESEQNPATAFLANVGGGLATGGLGATTKTGTALANSLRTGNLGARVAKGIGLGAASGAAYGGGTADYDKTLQGIGEGAVAGGITGGALPMAGAAIRKGVGGLVSRSADQAARKIAETSNEIPKSSLSADLQKVYDRLRRDIPDDDQFRSALYSYGSKKDQALIEAGGERTKNLAEGAAVYPSGNARAVEFFDNKIDQAPDKLKSSLSKTVSNSTNYSDDVDNLLETGRAKAAPLYQQAFARNQSINSPIINKILTTPEGKAALGDAVKNMQNEMSLVARPDPELTQLAKEAADLGLMDRAPGGVAGGLKLRTLDYVKKSMDDNIRKAVRAGDDAEVRRITNLKNGLVSEIDNNDKSGLYAKARSSSGDYLTTKKAMEDGLSFLSDDVENVPRRLTNLSSAQRDAYKAGAVKALRNQIDNTADGRNVAALFNRPSNRAKLQSILNPSEYTSLLNDAKATDGIYKLRNQLTGNSRTALRQAASEEFGNDGAEIIADAAQRGITKVAIDKTVGMIARKFDGLSDKLAGDVANILYETDPKKKYQIVKSLVNEANATGASLRKTQAAQQLKAFYSVSDAISQKRGSLTAGGLGGANYSPQPAQAESVAIPPSFDTSSEAPTSNSDANEFSRKLVALESAGNPNAKAKTSSALGLSQFTNKTWQYMVNKYGKEYGLTRNGRTNPEQAIIAANLYAEDNRPRIEAALGKPAEGHDLYLAHFLGAGGAVKLLKSNPRAVASQLLPSAAANNKAIFYDKSTGKPRTVAQVYQLIQQKWNRA